jgi:beta-lactamase class A
MKKAVVLLTLFIAAVLHSQPVRIPDYYKVDNKLSRQLLQIVTELGLEGDFEVGEDGTEQISLAVIDLNGKKPHLGGVHFDNFIYPASVYKMYVAAEVLHQISGGVHHLDEPYVAASPNVVDHSKQIDSDPRPLLQEGDTVTVNYLLDLMITRSDNSAANCLIDLAGRKNIDSLMHIYGWHGSEVTRKFLKRKFEDPGYETIRGTETCALHAADYFYRIQARTLVNSWMSMQLEALLGRQLDASKLASGLPGSAMFYHKTGWFAYWTNDAGLVDDGRVRYIIACFMPIPEEMALPKFKLLAEKVQRLMHQRAD